MAKKKRDNFSAATVRALRESVSNLCSHPECRALTIGPNEDKGKPTIVGTAAHITAASYGGPRFDPSLTQDQRKSYENGIWLCNNHARQIDVDPDKYPTELLHKWKEEAENHASENTGNKLFPEREVNKRALEYAIQMVNGGKSNLVDSSVQSLIEIRDKELESLDPRFTVYSTFNKSSCERKIVARDKPVPITLNAKPSANKKLLKLIESGEAVHLESNEYSFTGSPLFEKQTGGSLLVSQIKEKIDFRISVITESNDTVVIGDFNGHKFSGEKYLNIESSLFKGALNFKCKFDFTDLKGTSNVHFSFLRWNGIDVKKLPFFPRLEKIIPILKAGGYFSFEASFDGSDFINVGKTSQMSDCEAFHEFIVFGLENIQVFRKLSEKLNLSLEYQHTELNDEELEHLYFISDLLDGPMLISASELKDKTGMIELTLSESLAELPKLENSSVQFREKQQKVDSIMGQAVTLPKTQLEMVGCDSNILEQKGRNYKIEVILRDDGYYRWSLQDYLN